MGFRGLIAAVVLLILVLSQHSFDTQLAYSQNMSRDDKREFEIELIGEIEAPDVETINWVRSVAISLDDSLLAVGRETGLLSLYELPSLHLIEEFSEHEASISVLAFSSVDEQILASGSLDSTVRIWDARSQEIISTIENEPWIGVNDLDFHPSQDVLAFAIGVEVFYPPNNIIEIWDLRRMEGIASLEGHNSQIVSVEYSPSENILVTGDGQGNILVWDADDYSQIAQIEAHDIWVWDIAFYTDGSKFASVGDDGKIRLWDASTFRQIASNSTPMKSTQENRIEQIEFSERDKLFITANSDGYVHLWDAGSLEALFAFQAHELPVITLALSADNSFIVTGSPDETVRLWRIKSSSQDE